MYKVILSLFLLCFVSTAQAEVERRAIYILGFDSIDLVIADVDVQKNTLAQNVFTATEQVFDLHTSGMEKEISQKGQDKAIKALKSLEKKAEAYMPQASHAFMGNTFRDAKNAKQFAKKVYDETKLEVTVLNDQQEGIIALMATADELQGSQAKMFIWQMEHSLVRLIAQCNGEYFVFVLNLPDSMSSMVSKAIEKKSGNSKGITLLGKKEFNDLVKVVRDCLKQPPACITQKVQGKDALVVGLGSFPASLQSNRTGFDRAAVDKAVKARLTKYESSVEKEDQGSYPYANRQNLYNGAIADLIVITGIMDALGMQKVNQTVPQTSKLGYLLYPRFWGEPAATQQQQPSPQSRPRPQMQRR